VFDTVYCLKYACISDNEVHLCIRRTSDNSSDQYSFPTKCLSTVAFRLWFFNPVYRHIKCNVSRSAIVLKYENRLSEVDLQVIIMINSVTHNVLFFVSVSTFLL
jgi:hypothetical protein